MSYIGKIAYKSCKECSTKFPVTRKDREFCEQKCSTRFAVRRLRASKKIKIKPMIKRKSKTVKIKIKLKRSRAK